MNPELEMTFSAKRRECTWCGAEIGGGTDCLTLHEEDDDYYFCSDACAEGFCWGAE